MKKRNSDVMVIVPTLNEVRGIGPTLRELREVVLGNRRINLKLQSHLFRTPDPPQPAFERPRYTSKLIVGFRISAIQADTNPPYARCQQTPGLVLG